MSKNRTGCLIGAFMMLAFIFCCATFWTTGAEPESKEPTMEATVMPTATPNLNPPADVFTEPAPEIVAMMNKLAYSFHWNSNVGFYEDPHPHVGVSFSIQTYDETPRGDVRLATVAVAPGKADGNLQYDLIRVFFEDLGLPGAEIYRWYNNNASLIASQGHLSQRVGNYLFAATTPNSQMYVLTIGVEQ